jgi:hypothetical protein
VSEAATNGDKETEMKSFNRENELAWVEFDIDGEVFRLASVAPAMAVLDVAKVNTAEDIDKVQIIMVFLDQVLEPDSAQRFAARLRSIENPISIDQATSIAVWAMEEVYAPERPTPAPSSSPNGSGSTGPSTTDTASTGGSTPEPQTRRVL